jgi:hypothetical protein
MMKRFFIFFLITSAFLFGDSTFKINEKQAEYIAQKVWQNEGSGLDKFLIHWNYGEDFASLGIGHFIWFPEGHTERFREVFPMVLKYMEQKNVTMPKWLNSKTPCPWNNKEELVLARESNDKKFVELFNFLKETKPYQAMFMSERAFNALPQMLDKLDTKEEKELITKRFNDILYNADGSINEHGLYVITDYVNFKGEGTLESERYNGLGWGTLQVLQNIDPYEKDKFKAFSDSAKAMLSRRIANSPPARGEERWRNNWNRRVGTYILIK